MQWDAVQTVLVYMRTLIRDKRYVYIGGLFFALATGLMYSGCVCENFAFLPPHKRAPQLNENSRV